MDFLIQYNPAIQLLILASLLMGSSIVVIGISTFLPKMSKKGINILYSFSSGFILPLALIGLAGGGIGHLGEHYTNPSALDYFVQVVIALASGSLGAIIYLLIRKLIIKKSKEIHVSHKSHDHADELVHVSDIDSPKSKWVAIFLLLLHRIPSGITLGMALWGTNNGGSDEILSLGLVIAFVIHVIPEALIVYYRQIDMGYSKGRSFMFSISVKFIIVPFMYLAYYFAELIESAFWLMPMILIIGGVIMTLTSLSELMPGLIHNRGSSKEWYVTFIMIAIGIVLSLALVVIHHH